MYVDVLQEEATRIARAVDSQDPAVGLAAVRSLPMLVERLEALQGDSVAARALRRWDVTLPWARGGVEEIVGPGIDRDALATLGIDLNQVRERVESTFGQLALVRRRRCRHASGRFIAFMPRAKRALELAARELDEHGEQTLDCGHLCASCCARARAWPPISPVRRRSRSIVRDQRSTPSGGRYSRSDPYRAAGGMRGAALARGASAPVS